VLLQCCSSTRCMRDNWSPTMLIIENYKCHQFISWAGYNVYFVCNIYALFKTGLHLISRCHPVPQGAISCHQLPSSNIICHYVPLGAILCHQVPFGAIRLLGYHVCQYFKLQRATIAPAGRSGPHALC